MALSEKFLLIAGAYVSCWIQADSIKKASKMEKDKIEFEKWEVLEIDEAYEINGQDYKTNANGLEFYEQAMIDKWVLVFHTYPFE